MKNRFGKGVIRAALLAVMAGVAAVTVLSFVMVDAAGDVSPSDIVSQSDHTVRSADNGSVPSTEVKNLTATWDVPDFLLSSMPGRAKKGTGFKKYIASASYNGSYRSELDANEQKIYDGLYQAFVTEKKDYTEVVHIVFDPTIPFLVNYSDPETDTLSNDDLDDVYDTVLCAAAAFFYDCPEAFWVREFSIRVDAALPIGDEYGYVDWIEIFYNRPAYPNAYGDLSAYQTGLASAVNSIRQSRVNETDFETVKAIHNYIIYNASYNYDALSGSSYTYGYAYSAAPLFVSRLNGRFVCEGYSKAMKILCNEFGINCALVSGMGMTSDTSGGPHMWCYVQLGGKWYAADTTWDDGYYYQDGTPCLKYDYFLVGSGTYVKNGKTFSQNHISDGQVMSDPTKFSLVYPPLSLTMYNHYIVDTDPFVTIRTLGASIRVSDPYGIRYGIQIMCDEGLIRASTVPEFGTLIIPSTTLGNNDLTIDTPNVLKIKADNIYSQDDEQVTYTGVLINIPNSFFKTNIKGRGYLIYIDKDTGEEHIVYSEIAERSFYGVAQSAYDVYSKIQNPTDAQKEVIRKLEEILA